MADEFGGGISTTGNLFLVNSTISHNSAKSGGGGIENLLVVIAHGSTIAENRTEGDGGGIENLGSNVYLDNSTIANNTAAYNGGGIDTLGTTKFSALIDARYTTIYGNHADQGGGIAVENSSGVATNSTATILATIIAGNQASTGPDASGPLSLECPNLVQDETGASLSLAPAPYAGSVITGQSPNLGPLQDNGGPTQTLALLPGSPAIHAIPSSDTNCGVLATDQRSHPRPQGNGYDLGAYQVDHS